MGEDIACGQIAEQNAEQHWHAVMHIKALQNLAMGHNLLPLSHTVALINQP